MKLLLAVATLILASAAPGSGCGWTGLVLAPPDVQVHGQNVTLERPLHVVRVEDGSPAEKAGMQAGMEILSLDLERWDEGGFLGNLVRLQTVQPEDILRIVASDAENAERTFKLEAELCSESQARRRARTLANLGSMEGMIYGRQAALRSLDEARYPEAREMYERVLREHEAARRVALLRLNDPGVRLQIEESMRVAEEAMRRAMEGSMSHVREALEDMNTRVLVEESARRALEDARQALQGEEWRRQLEESMRHAQEALEQTRAHEMEMGLVQEQMRRALEDAAKGRDLRRLALLQASEATQRIRRVGTLFRGASFQRVEPGISRHVGVDHGLLVLNLEDDSPLADAGVEPGDVILSVDGRPVDDGGDLFEIVGDRLEGLDEDDDAPGSVELEIHQPSGRRTIRLPLTVASGSVVGPL